MKHIIALCFLISSGVAFGLETGQAFVEGQIKSFDQKEVILETKTTIITVPRKFVYEKKLISGKVLTVHFLASDENQIKIVAKKLK